MESARVVLVDDDRDDRDLFRNAFLECEFKDFVCLSSASELFAFLRNIRDISDLPSLIISDLNMPGINGRELAKALKQTDRLMGIPIVICSTSRHPADLQYSLETGVAEYHVKPSIFKDFIPLVSDLIKRYCTDCVVS